MRPSLTSLSLPAGVWLGAGSGGDVPSLSPRHLLAGGRILLRSHPLPGREQDPGGTGDGGDRQPLRSLPAGVSPAREGMLQTPSPDAARGPYPDPPLPPRRFYSPEGEREPRGRCLPCAAAPRSTPGCPGGCPGWRCHPGFVGAERAGACRADVCPGDAAGCVPLEMGGRCPAEMWQLRTSPLVTRVASASLGANPAVGLPGRWDLIPTKPLSGADPVPPPRPAASPQPRNTGLAGENQRDTGDPAG